LRKQSCCWMCFAFDDRLKERCHWVFLRL
jgi:hypothetical protein